MKTWQTLLREADPAAEARLSVDDADAMRRVVMVAAREPKVEGWHWQRPLAMALVVVLMLASGIFAGRKAALGEPQPAYARIPAEHPAERRQLQFSTPGGTRIIWVFNSEFELKETTP